MTRPLRAYSRSLPMLLLRSHQAVMSRFRPMLRAHGVTEQQWRVLRALSSVDEARITRLAELTLISKPSLSRLLPALESRRLIRRAAAAGDARGATIRLAPAGRALIDRVAPDSEACYREIGARIGEDALAALYELLPKLSERLETQTGDAPDPVKDRPRARRAGLTPAGRARPRTARAASS